MEDQATGCLFFGSETLAGLCCWKLSELESDRQPSSTSDVGKKKQLRRLQAG